jgi:hypothetical protein
MSEHFFSISIFTLNKITYNETGCTKLNYSIWKKWTWRSWIKGTINEHADIISDWVAYLITYCIIKYHIQWKVFSIIFDEVNIALQYITSQVLKYKHVLLTSHKESRNLRYLACIWSFRSHWCKEHKKSGREKIRMPMFL